MKIKEFIFNSDNKINKFLFGSIGGALLIGFFLSPLYEASIKSIKKTDFYTNFIDTGGKEYNTALNAIENNNYKKAHIYLEKRLKILMNSIGEEHKLTIETYTTIANLYTMEGNYEEALNFEKKALDIKYLIFEKNDKTIAESYYLIGSILVDKGEHEEALNTFKKAIEIYSDPEYYTNVANLFMHLGYYTDALHYYELSLKNNSPLENPKNFISTINNIQLIHLNNDIDIEKAKSFTIGVIDFLEKINLKNDIGLFTFYNNLGSIYEKEYNYIEAFNQYKKSIEILNSNNLDTNHPYFATAYNNIGLNYYYQSNYKKAIRYFSRAIKILEKFNKEHYYIAVTYRNFGLAYLGLKDYTSAEKYYKKSLELSLMNFEEKHQTVSDAYFHLGELYFETKVYSKALEMFKNTLLIQENIDKNNFIYKESIYALISNIYELQDKVDTSIVFFENELKKITKNDKREYTIICLELANLYIKKNMPDKAKMYYEKLDQKFINEEIERFNHIN